MKGSQNTSNGILKQELFASESKCMKGRESVPRCFLVSAVPRIPPPVLIKEGRANAGSPPARFTFLSQSFYSILKPTGPV